MKSHLAIRVLVILLLVFTAVFSVPVYGIVQNWLLRLDGWKVLAGPDIVMVCPPPSPSADVDPWSEAVVELRNITRKPVRVVGVQSSCGCISPIEQFPFVLNPTDKKQVRFQLHFDETVKDGTALGNVSFLLDDPSPAVQVSFQANLKGSG